MSGLGALLKGGSVVLTPLDVGMSPLLRVAATAGGCRCCSNQVPIIKSRKARSVRFQRNEILRHNRQDPALERAARKGTLRVPLDKVHEEWQLHRGRNHLQTVGLHFQIYRDIFGTLFQPRGFMRVVYGAEDEVHRGNIITAEKAGDPPMVTSLPRDCLSTLLLTNPDGHLLSNNEELLHWMITNIREGDLATGETVCPYLPPIPPRGTGFHRFVFALYTHINLLVSDKLPSVRQEASWLKERSFSTQRFLADHPTIQPYTFSFYQCQWDESVHRTYMDTLVYPEPVYDFEEEVAPKTLKQEKVQQKRAEKYRNQY